MSTRHAYIYSAYSKANFSKDDIIKNNEIYCQKCDLRLTEKDSPLRMYWLPKLQKTQIGARFIIASKNCSTKPLSGVISKISKMLFTHNQDFHKKSTLYSSYKKILGCGKFFSNY